MRLHIVNFHLNISPFLALILIAVSLPSIISAQGLQTGGGSDETYPNIRTGRLPVGLSYQGQPVEGDESAGYRPLTIEDCVDLALERSPDHQIARQALRASFGDLLAAWGVYIPTVFATYGFGKSNTSFPLEDMVTGTSSRITRVSESGYATLGMGYNLFNGAEKYFGIKNAYSFRRAMRSALRNSELEITNLVHAAFFDVLRQDKLLNASRELASQIEEQLKQAEARNRVGEITKLDVLQAQIDLQNQNLLVLEYENGLINAKMELDLVLGGALGTGFQLADKFDIQQPMFDVNQLISEALENHPQLDSLQMEINRQQGNLWMGRLAYLPVLKTQVGYSRNESEITLTPNFQRGRNLAFSMSWNILDSFERFKLNRYNQVQVNVLKYELQKARLAQAQAVRINHLELLRLYKRNLTLAESKLLAAQTLELENRRYELGSASVIELRKARADFFQAEVDYINSIYDFHQALSNLRRDVGRNLKLK